MNKIVESNRMTIKQLDAKVDKLIKDNQDAISAIIENTTHRIQSIRDTVDFEKSRRRTMKLSIIVESIKILAIIAIAFALIFRGT